MAIAMRNRLLLAAAFALFLSPNCFAQKTAQAKTVSLQPCEVDGASEGAKEKVMCASYEVFEDRVAKTGRKIAIKIVVFPATGPKKQADPFFYIPGGPGSSATEDAPYIAQEFAKIREQRDMVFVDQRGTGGSNPLNCELFNADDPRSYLGYYFPLEAVKRCRQTLEAKTDLKLYTTTIAMDDLDDVRAALGYDKINLLGVSYGTRAAATYLKLHGEHVRTVVLHGVSPSNQAMPRDFPQHTERALNGVIADCLADTACRTAFPDPRADADTVLARLLKGPVSVELTPKGSKLTVELSRDLAAEAIRYMLYQPEGASRIPLFLNLAARGNFAPLAEAALNYRKWIVATGSNGMYLSVTCAEDLPAIAPGVGERNAENTFLGAYRVIQQRAACALWPQAKLAPGYAEPTSSNAAALIITGQWDPVTPPAYGDTAAKHLPNSRHIIVPHGGHGFSGLNGIDCINTLIETFIIRGTTTGLDTTCMSTITRKGFQLQLPEVSK